MKRHPGKTRYVKFEGECFVSASDLSNKLNELGDPHFRHVAKYLSKVILDCSNLVPGMADKDKQAWSDIMKPN